jgi:hypothetical protein
MTPGTASTPLSSVQVWLRNPLSYFRGRHLEYADMVVSTGEVVSPDFTVATALEIV